MTVRNLLTAFGLILAGLSFAVAAAEIALRLAGIEYPVWYVPDRVTGMALMPGADVWQRQEGQAHVQISRAGLRDVEHNFDKPAGTFRIAVLGDSYAEAVQIPLEQTFWSVLGKKLAADEVMAGRRVEVINFGVSGFSTAQEFLTLQHRVWKFSPDLILLAITTGNDISDNSFALDQDSNVPYYVLNNGTLELDSSFLNSASFRLRDSAAAHCALGLLNYSRILQLINEYRRVRKSEILTHDKAAPTEEAGLALSIYQQPQDAVWQNAWRVTEELIRAIGIEAKEHGAGFLAVALSNPLQVAPDADYRRLAAARLKVQDLFYPEKRLAEFSRQNGIDFIALAPKLQSYVDEESAQGRKTYLHGFDQNLGGGHWNALGHKLAGELLANGLAERMGKGRGEFGSIREGG